MNLREIIEAGTNKAGEQKALASILHIHPAVITQAKAGKRGLPVSACIMLANYLGIESTPVIAASELVTEKDEERRKAFYPFVMGRRMSLIALLALTGITATPTESQAALGFSDYDSGPNWHYVKSFVYRCIAAFARVMRLECRAYGA